MKKKSNKCQWIFINEVIVRTMCGVLWDVSHQMIGEYIYCPHCGKVIIKEME